MQGAGEGSTFVPQSMEARTPVAELDARDGAGSLPGRDISVLHRVKMAQEELRTRADQRLDEVLRTTGFADPRRRLREMMRRLRGTDRRSFEKAFDYYENRLVPAVAEPASDPLAEWVEYGRLLANLSHRGRAVQIDPTGRATPWKRPVRSDHLVLHLPGDFVEPATVLLQPARLSTAQTASLRLLIRDDQPAGAAAGLT